MKICQKSFTQIYEINRDKKNCFVKEMSRTLIKIGHIKHNLRQIIFLVQ